MVPREDFLENSALGFCEIPISCADSQGTCSEQGTQEIGLPYMQLA